MHPFIEYIEWHEARVQRRTGRRPAASTLRRTRSTLRVALAESGSEGVEGLGTLTSDPVAVEALLDKLSLRMSSGALRLAYDALRHFNEYAQSEGLGRRRRRERAEAPAHNPAPPITVYTADEVATLVTAARYVSLRWYAFVATIAGTGRRVGEVLGLEWDHLHLHAEVPHFELPHTKNKRQAYVPLSTTLMQDVFTPENIAKLRTLDSNRPFTRDVNVYPFPWSYSTVSKMFARHCARVGVTDRGFHNFRHTKATQLIAAGAPISAVSCLLGHASSSTTERIYSHVTALNFANYLEGN